MAQSPIQLLPLFLDVEPLAAFLANCSYWNENKHRTLDDKSPHREADDIWAHFVPPAELGKSTKMTWYHDDLKSYAEPLVTAVYDYVGGIEQGGVLITRIPAGKRVYPHTDSGWHAEKFSKYCVCVRANQAQTFMYENAMGACESGRVFWFDNSYEHWVTNPTDEARVSMIVCIQTPQGVHHA